MISKEYFYQIMEYFDDMNQFAEDFDGLMQQYHINNDWLSGYTFTNDRADFIILNLLKNIFEDEDNWIEYWVVDCECGRNVKDCYRADGSKISLDTPEDLWNLLWENMNDNN